MKEKIRVIILLITPLWFLFGVSAQVNPTMHYSACAMANENGFVLFVDMPEFQVLKGKIEFDDTKSPDFSILSINRTPTPNERKALLRWAEIRERNTTAETYLPNYSNRYPQVRAWADQWYFNQKVLTAELCAGKLTYGEYARKRWDNFSFYSNKTAEYESAIVAEQQRVRNAQIQQAQYAAEQARLEKQRRRDEGIRILQNLGNQMQMQEAQQNQRRQQRLNDAEMLRLQQERNRIMKYGR